MKLRNTERTQRTAATLLNALIILVLTVYFRFVWNDFYARYVYYFFKGNILYVVMYAVLLVIFNKVYGGFNLGFASTSDLIFSQLISLLFANAIIFFQVILVRKHLLPVTRTFEYLLVDIIITVVLNVLFNKVFYSYFPPKPTLMVYEQEDQSIYERILKYQDNSYEIKKTEPFDEFDKREKDLDQYQCVVGVGLRPEQKEILVKTCYERKKSVYLVPDVYDVIVNSGKSVYLIDTPVFKTNNFGPSQLEKIVKRIWDIFFALVLLIITSPILLVTAIAIKAQDGGPVFYKQTRLTQYGRPFSIIKFRSMKIDAEKDGVARLASEHDDRITRVGRFIRACRIDELPQLINILNGDMSVVGPRPERPELIEKILEDVPEFNYRLIVKAGLTGYAQVYGKYNTKLKDKLLFDMIYIENFSLLLDLRIMFKTFKILFMKESTEGVSDEKKK
ncbi:MAG: sugar transferase [Solobacterium sp.]|nr:sugar transferase [Solobacterium sp.]